MWSIDTVRLGWFWRIGAVAIVWMATVSNQPYTWGQEPSPRGAAEQAPAPVSEPSLITPSLGPPISAYPLELLRLLSPPLGPVTVIPSLSISEEYTDNLLLDNRNRKEDFITGFGPAIMLFVNRPTYRLIGGYSFIAELFARESRFNNALDRQAFIFSGTYQGTRGLTLGVSDSFSLSRDTNLSASPGFATGRQESWSNVFSPSVNWQMTPGTYLGVSANYIVQRFIGQGAGLGSDTYSLGSTLSHVLTQRLTGSVGYGFTYLDLHGAETNSTTHTPRLGISYALTPTLTGSVSGGPAITEIGGQTFVTPAVTAGLAQAFRIGLASAQYSRSVMVAGGFGGTTNTQTFSGDLTLLTLRRGLTVAFSPSYSIAESVNHQQTQRVDARALSLNLRAAYQISRFVSVFAGYEFFQQRTGGSSTLQFEADQNRVKLGVQFGYPFTFN